ncbi:formyltransferase family protein, partial [bacterium]|nr:formyltransferase family protein [bacterium]
AEVADEIFLNRKYNLIGVIVQCSSVNNDLIYFSHLRQIPLYEVSNKLELERILVEQFNYEPILLLCGFGIILGEELLRRVEAYNFHFGKLPDYKGRHPTFVATLDGRPYIGVTLHIVVAGIDEGQIIAIDSIPYGYKKDENYLFQELPLSVKRLLDILTEYLEGRIGLIPNVGGGYYPPTNKKDRTFTKDTPICKILRMDKAQARHNGSIFHFNHQEYRVTDICVKNVSDDWVLIDGVFLKDRVPVALPLEKSKAIFFRTVTKI